MRQCRVHKKFEQNEKEVGFSRLRLNAAGVTCHAWSAEGSNAGASHDSEVPLAVWLAERVRMFELHAEDLAFVECTPRFPAQERLEQAFGSLAHVFSWNDGPEFHGWPHRRTRVLAVVVNKATVDWLGPTSLLDLQKDYSERFHRQTVVSGEMLMLAPDEERVEEMTALAHARKNNVQISEMSEIVRSGNLQKLSSLVLPAGGVRRLRDWQQVFEAKIAKPDARKPRAFLCDVDHNPSTKGGRLMIDRC